VAACSTPVQVTGYRNPAAKMYSSAVFDPARLEGSWRQVADFAPRPGCKTQGLRFASGGGGVRVEGGLCLAGLATDVTGPLVAVGPGRFAVTGVPEPVWVLWADTDVRTLVIGTPSGRFGAILNRGADLPGDRMTAAREVLDWNGYDLDRLLISP